MAMDSSSAQSHHHQEMSSQTLESMLVCTKQQQEKKPRPSEQAQKCPRCDSSNTKFCYYNNYSLSQPRFFCKSCRRYWTKGGTLRNVPVGGGCRKTKRSSSSSSSSSSRRSQDNPHQPMTTMPNPNNIPSFNPRLSYDSNDYFSSMSGNGNPNMTLGDFGTNSSMGLFDALRGGNLENARGFHNVYYGGMGNGIGIGIGIDQNGGMGMSGSQEMGLMGFEGTTMVKQEMSNGGRDQGESGRGLWGFPWQSIGGDGNVGDIDSGRGWNGIGSSNWHGLLNSPLM